MERTTMRVALVALMCAPRAAPGQAARGAAPALRVATTRGDVRVDGRLTEPAWSVADSIGGLTQVEPREGGAPSARTVVRVLFTRDAVVIGVRADDPEPARIVAYARQRDATLDAEDHVKIVLDTYRDGRSGYVFSVNPNGARYDALVTDQGAGENANWDAVWQAATARTPEGWSAEILIPLKSLLFRPGRTEWGFNVQRRIQRLQETDRWASPERDIKVTQTSRAGRLVDLPRVDLGVGLSVRPSVTGGGAHDTSRAPLRSSSRASLDATQRLGANTLASLTVNTDFAETEVDARRVNLTRFPLFFPEKRTFFLEGADIFDFGLGLEEDVIPFFSRRIGLLAGEQVPIDVGAKVTGRAGGTNFGALAVRTRQVDTLPTAAAMGVVRVKQNVLGESSAGFIATVGDPLGRRGSWLVGPDLTYSTSRFHGDRNFLVGVWGLATGRADLVRGDRTAAGFKVDYPNDLWDVALSYKRIGDGFDPSLGFVPRPGVHVASLAANWQPRPRRPIGPLHIRQCFWENELSYVSGLTGGWQSYEYFMAPINCRLESGDRFEFNVVPRGERLTEPFDVADGVTIPAGTYHFPRFRLEGGLAAKRRLNAQATWWFGRFYDGTLHQYELTGAWKPSPLVIVELTGEHDVGRLREGRFTQDVAGTRVRLNVSPDLQLTSFLQYDTESRAFGTNTRLRWTYSPLGELFVVYDHNLRTRDPLTLRRELAFASNQLLVKAQYAFRY
ncbi:carbohydrate binding family 9 domain-containing protein [Gemmatirosa kalamazoonensis]|nr:carbohydrate binding family 9 domain-containing protein [Gemmatirosa kalamazoonensis]